MIQPSTSLVVNTDRRGLLCFYEKTYRTCSSRLISRIFIYVPGNLFALFWTFSLLLSQTHSTVAYNMLIKEEHVF